MPGRDKGWHVSRFDRYLLSQLLWLFGFFSLVLVLVYWVNRAVSLFDQIIANGHSAAVFLEFTALTLPNVIRLVLPVSAFAAALYVTNRLSSESELVAVQAAGYSPARLGRTVAVYGLVVALLVSALTQVLVPISSGRLAQRSAEIAQDVTARLLSEGEFLHPAEGITFYIRDITSEGELRDIFLSDQRQPDRQTTYTAARALLLRTETGPKLVMFDGMAQSLRADTRQLATTAFENFTYDVSGLLQVSATGPRDLRAIPTTELIRQRPAVAAETGRSGAEIVAEAHMRVTQALKSVALPVMGFAILMMGGFSRFGLWRQILIAVFAVIVFETLDNAAADAARNGPGRWPLLYLPHLAALALSAALLWSGRLPGLGRREGRA